MSNKLTAVESLYFTLWKETDFSIPSAILERYLKIENEQNIKAAARGFLNRQEEINSLTKKFQQDNIMNEKIIEKLMTENLMLSNNNVKVRQAYMELLRQYAYFIQNKSSSDIVSKELEMWENKVK
jgi:hypothetical protein